MQTAYDMEYAGPAFDPKEGERLAGVLGDKTILIMANHGVMTVGRTVAEAYDRLYYIERAAQGQLYAMWTGKPLHLLPEEVVEETIALFKTGPRYGNRPSSEHHFDALKRQLERSGEIDYQS